LNDPELSFLSLCIAVRKGSRNVRKFNTGVTGVQSGIPANAGIQVRWVVWEASSGEPRCRDECTDGYRHPPV